MGVSENREIHNPFFARLCDRVLSKESERMRVLRESALAGLSGRVVEIGPGNGPNFSLYPSLVAEVVAVEPEPYLRARAEEAAADAKANIRVVSGVVDALPVEDGWADAVVCCLVLCSVPDQRSALAAIRRVLRPEGELRLLEHVGSHNRMAQGLLRAAEVSFWARAFGNCHPTRHTLAAIEDAGFDTSGVRRSVIQVAAVAPPLPHIIGTARCPGTS